MWYAGGMNWKCWEPSHTSNFYSMFIFLLLHLLFQMVCPLIAVWKVSGNAWGNFHSLHMLSIITQNRSNLRPTWVKAPIFGNVLDPIIISFIIRLSPWHESGQLRIHGHFETMRACVFLTLPVVSETNIRNCLAVNWTITWICHCYQVKNEYTRDLHLSVLQIWSQHQLTNQ